MSRLVRPVHAALGADEHEHEREQAIADVEQARQLVEATRRRVAARLEGAAAPATAEYRHHQALRRLDELDAWTPPEGPAAA